jgi:hypothetical protein
MNSKLAVSRRQLKVRSIAAKRRADCLLRIPPPTRDGARIIRHTFDLMR